jgi:hypothetical protein
MYVQQKLNIEHNINQMKNKKIDLETFKTCFIFFKVIQGRISSYRILENLDWNRIIDKSEQYLTIAKSNRLHRVKY